MQLKMKTFGNPSNLALVLIHPFPFDSRLWEKVATTLGDKYFVVTPDLRGCGESKLGNDAPSIELLAQDVFELITQLNLTKPIVGGISLGGYVAMALAKSNPEVLGGLILVDTKASADASAAVENRLRVAKQMRESGKVELFAQQMLVNVVGQYTHENRPEVVAQVNDWMVSSSADTIAWLQEAMATRKDSFETLASLNIPTLLIRGSQDVISSAEDFIEMEKNLKQVTRIEIENSGHLPPIEDPTATASAIVSWLTIFADR